MLTALIAIIGSSIGGIFAFGTVWAGIKRYIQRSLARQLAEAIPRNAATAIVLANAQRGKVKANWICSLLQKHAALQQKDTVVLDVAGGTNLDLLEELSSFVKRIDIFDSKVAAKYLSEHNGALLTKGCANFLEAESRIDNHSLDKAQLYDIVIGIDILHSI